MGSGRGRFFVLAAWIAMAVSLSAAAGAWAQAYPTKPIRLVVGFPPGGGNDITSRLLAAKMQETWGQPVVVDNKPGANSIIAAEFVAKSAPDGYTLLVNGTGGMSINPVLYAKLPYDPRVDFVPITTIGVFAMAFAIHPSILVNTLQEFIAYARAHPGKLSYGSAVSTFQLAAEMFKQMTGTDIVQIPFKGSAPSLNALLAGDVQMSIDSIAALLPHIRSGRVKPLAVASAKRISSMPELPTMAEAGVPGYEISTWLGVFAPAGTARDIVSKLNVELVRIVRLPDVREKLMVLGAEPLGNTSEQTAEMIRGEIARYGPVVKRAGMKAD